MLLKLVNDTSSIEATMRSNHTLTKLHVIGTYNYVPALQTETWVAGDEIQRNIDSALIFNRTLSDQGQAAVGKEKIIQTQLHSQRRTVLCRLQEQEVEHSVFNEIDPLHLPEVLSWIGKKHGQGELYAALLSSIMPLFSTMNREGCIQQKKEYHAAKAAEHEAIAAEHRAKEVELENELAAMRDSAGVNEDNVFSQSSSKRRRA